MTTNQNSGLYKSTQELLSNLTKTVDLSTPLFPENDANEEIDRYTRIIKYQKKIIIWERNIKYEPGTKDFACIKSAAQPSYNFFEFLPLRIMKRILYYLNAKDYSTLRKVSKEWNRILKNIKLSPLLRPIYSTSLVDLNLEIDPKSKSLSKKKANSNSLEQRSVLKSGYMFKRLSQKFGMNFKDLKRTQNIPPDKYYFLEKRNFKSSLKDSYLLLTGNVDKFLKALDEANLSENDVRDEVGFFRTSIEEKINSSPSLKNCEFYEIASLKQEVENYLFYKLFQKISMNEQEKELNDALEKRIEQLAWITPIHLELPEKFYTNDLWANSGQELASINNFYSPQEKILCIVNSHKILNFLLNESGSQGSADDLLPMLIWIILRSGVKHLHFNIKFIEAFADPDFLTGATSYHFINIIGATSFISMANAGSLKISEEEFTRKMGLANGIVPESISPVTPKNAKLTPNKSSPIFSPKISKSPSKESLEKVSQSPSKEKKPMEQIKNSPKNNQKPSPNPIYVNHTKRSSATEDSKNSPSNQISKSLSSTFGFFGKKNSDDNQTKPIEKSQLSFLDRDPTSITEKEIPKLLAEYKQLANLLFKNQK